MCWKTLTAVALFFLILFWFGGAARMDKEGFVTYVVYGPDWGNHGWGGPGGWPYGYRPYWGWRRRWWRPGPCPGPWCPYAW